MLIFCFQRCTPFTDSKQNQNKSNENKTANLTDTNSNATSNVKSTNMANSTNSEMVDDVQSCLARIMPVKVSSIHNPNHYLITLAFLDEGSDRSFVEERIIDQLCPTKHETFIESSSLHHQDFIKSFAVSGLKICSISSDDWIDLPVVLSHKSIRLSRNSIPTKEMIENIPHLQHVASAFPDKSLIESCSVGLLIARDVPEGLKPISCTDGIPYAIESRLGWGVIGGCTEVSFDGSESKTYTFLSEITPSEFLKKFEHDFEEISYSKLSQEDLKFMSILENGIHMNSEGHYEMPLPFKKDVPNIEVNSSLARKRLKSLKRKFEQDADYKTMYCSFMNELIESGDCEVVPESDLDTYPRNYIPHHGVINDKKPGKIRVVFDCSAQTNGNSLNDILLQGPDQLNSLVGVLCRFRMNEVAFACDVQKMFHQFHVIPEHRDYLRFFWWSDGDSDKPPSEYRMKVHIFGATSSPGCATYGLRQIAKDNRDLYPESAAFLEEDFYVDDGLSSSSEVSEAVNILKGAVDMCQGAQLRLHKIISNSPELLSHFPDSEISNVPVTQLTLESIPAKERTLGLLWDITNDRLQFHFQGEVKSESRRGILATVASIYDPLGFVSPFVLKGRIILQEMCKDGLSWDDAISERLKEDWRKWTNQFIDLKNFSVPRCFKPAGFGPIIEIQVHHFSDASTVGYGQCTYLRYTNADGNSHCVLVCAKSRVVPLKKPTVPRLELQAAVLSAKASKFVNTHLKLGPIKEIFWTDSQIVLAYLHNQTRRFHTFVATAVSNYLVKTASKSV